FDRTQPRRHSGGHGHRPAGAQGEAPGAGRGALPRPVGADEANRLASQHRPLLAPDLSKGDPRTAARLAVPATGQGAWVSCLTIVTRVIPEVVSMRSNEAR